MGGANNSFIEEERTELPREALMRSIQSSLDGYVTTIAREGGPPPLTGSDNDQLEPTSSGDQHAFVGGGREGLTDGDTGHPPVSVGEVSPRRGASKACRQLDIRQLFIQPRTPSIGRIENMSNNIVTTQAPSLPVNSFLHPGDDLNLNLGNLEDNMLQKLPDEVKTSNEVERTNLERRDDDLWNVDSCKCVFDMTSRRCEVHDCVLVEMKVSVLKWCYQPSKKCYGNVRRKITRWSCSGRNRSKLVLEPCSKN